LARHKVSRNKIPFCSSYISSFISIHSTFNEPKRLLNIKTMKANSSIDKLNNKVRKCKKVIRVKQQKLNLRLAKISEKPQMKDTNVEHILNLAKSYLITNVE